MNEPSELADDTPASGYRSYWRSGFVRGAVLVALMMMLSAGAILVIPDGRADLAQWLESFSPNLATSAIDVLLITVLLGVIERRENAALIATQQRLADEQGRLNTENTNRILEQQADFELQRRDTIEFQAMEAMGEARRVLGFVADALTGNNTIEVDAEKDDELRERAARRLAELPDLAALILNDVVSVQGFIQSARISLMAVPDSKHAKLSATMAQNVFDLYRCVRRIPATPTEFDLWSPLGMTALLIRDSSIMYAEVEDEKNAAGNEAYVESMEAHYGLDWDPYEGMD